jgi:hypothetical protein
MRTRTATRESQGLAEDGWPTDIDELRLELARGLFTLQGMPRRCRERGCRRARACVGKSLRCQHDFPSPPISEKIEAARLGFVQKLLRERFEAVEKGEEKISIGDRVSPASCHDDERGRRTLSLKGRKN